MSLHWQSFVIAAAPPPPSIFSCPGSSILDLGQWVTGSLPLLNFDTKSDFLHLRPFRQAKISILNTTTKLLKGSTPGQKYETQKIENLHSHGWVKRGDMHCYKIQNTKILRTQISQIHMWQADSEGGTRAVSLIILCSARNLKSSISSTILKKI